MKMRCKCIKLLVAGFVFLMLPFLSAAQGFQMEGPYSDKAKLGLRFLHPDFESDEGMSVFSGLYELSFSIALSPKVNLVTSLPMGTMNGDNYEAQSAIGNIYGGVQINLKKTTKTNTSLSVGVYLPTTNRKNPSAAQMGMCSNFSKCFQFDPNLFTVSMRFSHYYGREDGWFFGSEVGPYVLIPSGSDGGIYGEQVELLAHYGLTAGYRFKHVELKGEFTGIAIITEDFDEFNDRFLNELVVGLKWRGRHVQPGIFYKFNLDKDIRELSRGSFGVGIDIKMK